MVGIDGSRGGMHFVAMHPFLLSAVAQCYGFPYEKRLGYTLVAIPIAVVAGWLLYRLVEPLRHGDQFVRFFARAIIFGIGTAVYAGIMYKLGGECVFSGPTKGNGFNHTPFTPRLLLIWSLSLGAVFGLFVPAVLKARGKTVDW